MSLEARERDRALMLQSGLAQIESGSDHQAREMLAAVGPEQGEDLAQLFDLAGELRAAPLPSLSETDLVRIEAELLRRSGRVEARRSSDWQPWWIVAALVVGLLGLTALLTFDPPVLPWGELGAGPVAGLDGPPPPTAVAARVRSLADPTEATSISDARLAGEAPDLGAHLLADLQATAAARDRMTGVLVTSSLPRPIGTTPVPTATLGASATPTSSTARGSGEKDDPPEPTLSPTSIRMPSATASATGSPTAVPTERPTDVPTGVPSEAPTPEPSPEPTEEPEAVLEVILIDADSGDRVAEAEVSAIRVDGGPRIDGRSGREGVARLVIAGGLSYLVVAESDRHRSRWWPDAAEREGAQEIVVAPRRAREIELRLQRRSERGSPGDGESIRTEWNRGARR